VQARFILIVTPVFKEGVGGFCTLDIKNLNELGLGSPLKPLFVLIDSFAGVGGLTKLFPKYKIQTVLTVEILFSLTHSLQSRYRYDRPLVPAP
jgi:hypothetical protein